MGVNRFATPEPPPQGLLRVDPAVRQRQIERLEALRKRRDAAAVRRALDRLGEVARSDDNTLPVILEAVEACATLGEISDTLRRVFGEQKEFVVF